MKKNLLRLLLAVAILVLAGCTLPTGLGPGPRAWIDDPLDGATLALGPVVVQSHASSERGTTSAALLINGAQVRMDNAANSSDPLTSFAQAWTPTASGDYTLEVVATDPQGNTGRSNRVLVHIGTIVVSPTPTPVGPASLPIISPPPTSTFTPVPPAILTVTPSAIPNLIPTFTFTINGNCRQGPGTAYEVVTSFYAGDKVKIVGRNEDSSWYWVLIPNSNSHCAVSASVGLTQGPLDGLVYIPAPALPATTVAPPVPSADCSAYDNKDSCTTNGCNWDPGKKVCH